MATVYTGINMTAYNINQARLAAQNLGILYDASHDKANLVTKIKAK